MNNFKKELVPVILSGGKGSRLWPLSRECFPKQYINIDQTTDKTLLQKTFLRLQGIPKLGNPIIICNEQHRFIVAEQMRSINVKPDPILLEPFGRNTAPAITMAALISIKKNNDPHILILSSDHEIRDHEAFQKIINRGLVFSSMGRIVTFGIPPNSAETGYGYIESLDFLSEKNISSNIKRFIEKPSLDDAKKYIKNKNFRWNSGIFLFKSSTILNEIKKYQPSILEVCQKALKDNLRDLDFIRVNKDIFATCPNIPIDKAVMEKTKIGTVLDLKSDWLDIGCWKAVWENSKKDHRGNSVKGHALLKNSTNCHLRSENRLVVGLGLKNITVVETIDAVLVTENNSTQKVKNIVDELKKRNFSESQTSSKMYRPWGHYTSIVEEKTWKVKRIEINPNSSLSLQSHKYRAEHWVVVDGTAKVEIDKKITLLQVNESIYVPKGTIHRLSNTTNYPLIIIEIQSGSYLGEDDILRLEDNYGRN
ncbi:mannose-1-phosphate guanylyltransferase/mannose-6-phosphate isomerase [Prochlorococcus marinus XMU1419]|uniref:mannose-1-phosphate guanylyltransferase/mannose-6-phosphate isomerase n=1 Tax=Prochlorococcus marinus TaxID=1219 RepID=UPI001ADBEDAD|nr:mannose-1-phosphate guanylyltransferase/mannose-6-phosphate isomerase [Prochlorococcus marinus]MBO8234224.1 mannose-1-phosphate guanylyltransferase/mannose-6-phosphate isomerase [Prochlorococcus marinus XMU1419]MBW3075914.1 mannose-1-phosphate guanylyltransferase/mannose-6-phosphate isomerase [Prochlorococcus marinus str. XMU1419]